MKALLLVLLLAQQAFSANLVSESTIDQTDCGTASSCAVKQQYAQVCIRNFDTRHNLVVRTTWGFGTYSRNRIPHNTQLVFRLTTDESNMEKAAFQVSFLKSMETKEVTTMPLEIEWTEKPVSNCDELPAYQFQVVKNSEMKEEFTLTKIVPKP